jgi:hypothetical protein
MIGMRLHSIAQKYLVAGVGLSVWLTGQAYAETSTYLCITDRAVTFMPEQNSSHSAGTWKANPVGEKYLIRKSRDLSDETIAWRVFNFEESDPMHDLNGAKCDELKEGQFFVCDGIVTVLFWKRILKFKLVWGWDSFASGSCTPL